MSNNDFTHFAKRILTDPAKFISWCPVSDLLLIVSLDNALSLYRVAIKQLTLLWSSETTFDSTITSVTWKPDGKELAIGCENGVVYKVDTRYESFCISQCWPPEKSSRPFSAIRSLFWTHYESEKKDEIIEGFDSTAFDPELSLPMLSHLPLIEPTIKVNIRHKKKTLPERPFDNAETQTILFVGTDNGDMIVILNGVYQIGAFNLSQEKDIFILDIVAANAISSIKVFGCTKSTNEPCLLTVDTSFLESKKEEISKVAERKTRLDYLFQYAAHVIETLKDHHSSYTKLTKNVVVSASDAIISNNGELQKPIPEVEFIAILATGNLSQAIRELITDELTPQFIKQWETTNNHGYQSSLRIICEHALPVFERILLQLSDSLGHSLWKERYEPFLDVASVESCIDHVNKLIVLIRDLAQHLRRLIKLFGAFIAWIIKVSSKLADPESTELQNEPTLCEKPEWVFEYLEEWFVTDKIAKFFIESNGNDACITKLLSDTVDHYTSMFQKPSETISKEMNIKFAKYRLHESNSLLSSITTENCLYYVLLQNLQKSDFSDQMPQYACISIANGDISDAKFFDDKELSILVKTGQDTTILYTLLLNQISYTHQRSELTSIDLETQHERHLLLDKMTDVNIGCNGLPNRRVFATVASNGLLNIYSMDKQEELEEELDE
ncbi:hypothetical protein RMATCC62417_10280 [Rhizopus microsporus]|nr:hypothetical protein RMATCC62417_10280 [Rhizopus microsporus]